MKKFLFLFLLITNSIFSQTISGNNKNLVIKHKDITLYLDTDTSIMVSKLDFKYSNFVELGSYSRCNCWFIDLTKKEKDKLIKMQGSKLDLKRKKNSVHIIESLPSEEVLELDDILDKIGKYGIDSLTKNEKDFLDNISNS